MHPFEQSGKTVASGVKPSLQVVLKEGWQLGSRNRAFISPAGEETPLKGILPARSRILPTVPSLADADAKELSEEERYLARHLQVALPSGTDVDKYAEALRQLDAIEEVRAQPVLGLP